MTNQPKEIEKNVFQKWSGQLFGAKLLTKISKCEEINECRFSVTNQWVLVHGGPCNNVI